MPSPSPSRANAHSQPNTEPSAETESSTAADRPPDLVPSQDLKRIYLSLLPLVRVVEICLTFEPHVPLHVTSTVWPVDLAAAISELTPKKTLAPPSTQATEPPQPSSQPQVNHSIASGPSYNGGGVPPIGSLQPDPSSHAHATPPPFTPSPQKAVSSASASPAPQPQASTSSTPAPTHLPQPLASYPYTPYGYPTHLLPHAPAYPHTPYYPPPAHYPHPPYYHPPPPHPHAHAPYPPPPAHAPPPASPAHHPPPASHTHASPPPPVLPHTHQLPPAHQHAPSPPPPPPPGALPYPAEDLPSYEEMIVEALIDGNDPSGAAPKDLFAWMAAHYPLQTNFRPSASQALQKAYRRGRLEKQPGGRYRLNPNWEGGATSKRATRRPQTLAQTTYAMHHSPQSPSSPFTHAPLAHHPRTEAPPYPVPQGGPGSAPYYPYGYLGYPPQPATMTDAQATAGGVPGQTQADPSGSQPESGEKDKEGDDDAGALEAAQHILRAINFGGIDLGTLLDSTSRNGPTDTTAVPEVASATASAAPVAPPPIIAGSGFDIPAGASMTNASEEAPRTTLTNEERAALQAQLALLAVQLADIANTEDEEDEDIGEEETAGPASIAPEGPGQGRVTMDVNQFPEEFSLQGVSEAVAMVLGNVNEQIAQSQSEGVTGKELQGDGDEEESDEDDDMEMVEVPTYVSTGENGLRT